MTTFNNLSRRMYSRDFVIQLGVSILFGLLAFWINRLAVHVWTGVDIILGVPLAVLIAAMYGPFFGGLAAAIGTSRTVFMWRHPYALIIYVLESIVVGTLVGRGASVAVSSLLFWSCAGIPFVFFCYAGILGLSTQFALMIAVTDCLAGLFGAILVHLIGMPRIAHRIWRALQAKPQLPSLRADIFTITILMGTLPLAVLLGYDGYYLRQQREEEAKLYLRGAVDIGASCFDRLQTDQQVRLSLIFREVVRQGAGGADSLAPFALQGETLEWAPRGEPKFTVSSDPSGALIRIRQAYSSGDRALPRQLVSDRVFPVSGFCLISQAPTAGWRISVFAEDFDMRGTPWTAAGLKVRRPDGSIIRDLTNELAARKPERSSASEFEFQKTGPDAFRRGRYLVATRRTANGLLLVAYQPASAAARGVAEFQHVTIFWLIVTAILSVLFAHGTITRILNHLASLGEHLSEMKLANASSVPRPDDLPVELRSIWKGVGEMQRRLGETLWDLSTAADRATRATKQKSDFLATISHEIRTPLNCILGMLPAVAKGPLTPRQQEALSMMRRSGEHLLLLVNDVLDFSKIESGSITIQPIRTELIPFLDECFLLLKPTARSKQLFFWWHFKGAFPKMVLCDGTRLRQILFNVIGNAIKFTSSGEVFIAVRIREENGHSVLAISVQDTGPGIEEASIDSVFAPFSQLAVPVGSVEFAGAGLGLAICRQLLELMDGSISISSSPGAGTVVRIRVPITAIGDDRFQPPESQDSPDIILVGPPTEIRDCLVDHFRLLGKAPRTANTSAELEVADADNAVIVADEFIAQESVRFATKQMVLYPGIIRRVSGWSINPGADPEEIEYCWPPSLERLGQILAAAQEPSKSLADSTSPGYSPVDHFPLAILVAEDNLENRIVAELVLHELGYTPQIVPDGEAAMAAILNTDFDLCLIDLRMPKLSGISVAQQVRAERGPRAPFLTALTASAFTEDRELCLQAGFDAFLSKPLRQELLRELIASRVIPDALEKFKQQGMDIGVYRSFVALLSKAGPDLAGQKVNQILNGITDWILKATEGPEIPQTARDDAHKWAGSALLIGASRLVVSLGRMEKFAAAADLGAWRREAQGLGTIVAKTKAAISMSSPDL